MAEATDSLVFFVNGKKVMQSSQDLHVDSIRDDSINWIN